MHYYKRNLGDYHKKAGKLSIQQHGIYNLLMDSCYDREIFPTKEQAIDWCWAEKEDEISDVNFVLKKFFTPEGDIFVQKRISEELAEYKKKVVANQSGVDKRERKRKEAKEKKIAKSNDPSRPVTTRHDPSRDVNDSLSTRNGVSTTRHPTNNQEPITNNQEPITNNQEPKEKNTSTAIEEKIFNHWICVMKKKNVKFTTKRRSCIRNRLKEKYSELDIFIAIDNCAKSSYHMGQNDQSTVYDDLTLICRSGDKLEYFRDNIKNSKPNSSMKLQEKEDKRKKEGDAFVNGTLFSNPLNTGIIIDQNIEDNHEQF